MIPLVRDRTSELIELCERFGVARLEVFGSAADQSFDSERSDIDLLVQFKNDADMGPWLARYSDFREALTGLVGRSVDLVMLSALRNPYFIREVNRTRELLYAA